MEDATNLCTPSQIKRQRWLEKMLREAEAALPAPHFAALAAAATPGAVDAFIRRRVPLPLSVRAEFEQLDRKRREAAVTQPPATDPSPTPPGFV